jgi:hypothetical protein
MASRGLLVQGNHYRSPEFQDINWTQVEGSGELLETSAARVGRCESMLAGCVGKDEHAVREQALSAYADGPVFNHETTYWTYCDPAKGAMDIWRYTS